MRLEGMFDQPRVITFCDSQDGQRLYRTLIDPSRWQLALSSDADLDARGVRQINDMRPHTVGQAPFRLATGAEVIVTGFRGYDATVALCKTGETGVTVALTETFSRVAPAVGTFNLLQVIDSDSLAQIIAECHSLPTELQTVSDRFAVFGMHLVKMALKLHILTRRLCMSHSANACLCAARRQNAALVLLKQVLTTQLRADTRWPNLLITRELGASDKRQLSVAALVNGTTRAGPMSAANAVGLTCELRLDLTLIRNPEYGIHSRRVNVISPGQAENRFLQRAEPYFAPARAFIDDAVCLQQLY